MGRALEGPLSRGLFLAAAVLAVATQAVMTATFVHLSPDQAWPAATTSGWFLARGWVAQNLGTVLFAGGAASLLPPAALTVLAVVLVVRAARPVRPALPIALLAGAAPLLGLLLRPPALSYEGRVWRAAVLGAFSGRDPERVELRAAALEASTPGERRRAMGAWRVYGPLPPPEPPP